MQRFYTYMPVKIHFGFDLLEDETLFDLPYFKALIMTDKSEGLKSQGYLDKLLSQLKKHNIKSLIFDQIDHPLNKETIRDATAMVRDFNCDMVLAFGGGKVIDAAKLTARFAREDFSLYEAWVKSGIKPPFEQKPLDLLVIPTNLNITSSINAKAFVHDAKNDRYHRFRDDSLYPWVSLIDPALFKTLDKMTIIPAVMDSLARAFEMIIDPQSIIHRMKSIEVMRLILDHIAGIQKSPIADQTLYQLTYAIYTLHHLDMPKTKFPLHQMSDTIEGIHEKLPHSIFLSYGFLPYIDHRLEAAKANDIEIIKRLFEATPYHSNNLYVAFKNLFEALNLPAFDFQSYGLDLALVSDYMVHLKSLFPQFDALKDDALYDIIEGTLLKGGESF